MSSKAEAPTFACVGSIIIDDIVQPSGKTMMETLGGGGVHAAAGMTVWGERPALIACMGAGIPESALERFRSSFDMRGLTTSPKAQARAWQLFEWDGRRRELWRVDDIQPFLRLPLPSEIDPILGQAQAITVLRDDGDMNLWRPFFPKAVALWEPEQQYMIPENRKAFVETLKLTEIVSPNLDEARLLYRSENAEPGALIRQMLDDGARIVALRMGPEGSLLGKRGDANLIHIPAIPVPKIVDQTGAGNTFCGGFMVGWLRSNGDLREAGCYGAVAASFALENVGVLAPVNEATYRRRDERYAWVKNAVR